MILVRHATFALLIGTTILGCKEEDNRSLPIRLDAPISVIHRSPQNDPLEEPPYPHMWYYRTELHNDSDRELRIIWFEAYVEEDGVWYPGNATGRTLRAEDFSAWYAEGDPIVGGILSSGKTAVCDVNWQGASTHSPLRMKWAYIAVDGFGFDYFVESEVPSDILKHVHQDLPSVGDANSIPAEPQRAD